MRRYVEGVLRFRLLVIGLALLVSGILGFQIRNLRVVVDPNATLPQKHPYVSATRDAERLFRLKHQVLIGITSRAGDAFDPAVLRKVQQVTSSLVELPGVERGSVFSLARRAKNIIGTADGLEVLPLMDSVPQGEPEIAAMRQAVHNNPVYIDAVISRDARTAAVLADFFGTDAIPFSFSSDSLPGVTRSYPSFWGRSAESGCSPATFAASAWSSSRSPWGSCTPSPR